MIKPCLLIFLAFTMNREIVVSQNAGSDSTTTLHPAKPKILLQLSADLVSRYIWRGLDFGNSPSVQPNLSLSIGGFEIGCWSAVSFTNTYKEVDLWVKYSFRNLSLTFTDYYVPSLDGTPASPNNKYFVYADKKTAHTFEGSLMFRGGEKFPLWVQAGVFFYGNDKRYGFDTEKDSTESTYYSTYVEAGYSFSTRPFNVDLFAGFTPFAGAYGDEAGIVNAGLTVYKDLKITGEFVLPVSGSLIFNPSSNDVYFVFGIKIKV